MERSDIWPSDGGHTKVSDFLTQLRGVADACRVCNRKECKNE